MVVIIGMKTTPNDYSTAQPQLLKHVCMYVLQVPVSVVGVIHDGIHSVYSICVTEYGVQLLHCLTLQYCTCMTVCIALDRHDHVY